jgi:cell division protein FtsW (lipid II flippase)
MLALVSLARPHLAIAMLMFTMIAFMAFEPDSGTRTLYIVPVAALFVILLALLGIEYEAVGRAGWREYAERRITDAKAKMEMQQYLDGLGYKMPWEPHVPRFRASGKAKDQRIDYG